MIELRWVEREITFLDGQQIIMSDLLKMMPGEIVESINPGSFRTSTERVLQYRQQASSTDQYGVTWTGWSDWQDVPTVSEADGTFTASVDVTSRNIG